MHTLYIALLVLSATIAISADRYHPEHLIITKRNINNFNSEERSAEYWKNEALAGIQKRVNEITNNRVARNVILFLGDGLSIQTQMAARTYKGQLEQYTGEESTLFFETFPTFGLAKTYCLDAQIPDSACTATAYLSGIKNNDGTIGVTGAVRLSDCLASTNKSTHLESIAAWALKDGRDAGIVTTTRVTDASPAGTYARIAHRGWENDADIVAAGFTADVCPDIAQQLINTSPGKQFKVILGGGRRNFIPTTMVDEEGYFGRRTDGRNLIKEWEIDKESLGADYKYIANRNELLSLRTSPPKYLLGLFASDHLQYHLQSNTETEPTLAELTEVAINSLRRNRKGYFLFVEGGRIDHAHHETWPKLALDETVQFDLAIEKAVDITVYDDDTLIVVTADHAHVMTVNGYTRRGSDILGVSDQIGDDGVPYMTLSYTNGPGARPHTNGVRPDVTQDGGFENDLEWQAHAEVPLGSETHGGDDVAVLAFGPHHHMFSGIYEQSQIAWRMAYAACWGPGIHSEYCKRNSGFHINPFSMLYSLTVIIMYLCL